MPDGNAMYKSEFSSTDKNYSGKAYIGITVPPFKGRLGNLERDFKSEEYANNNCLKRFGR